MDLATLVKKLREAVRQQEALVLWHIRHDNLKFANEIAGGIVRKRELLRILEAAYERLD